MSIFDQLYTFTACFSPIYYQFYVMYNSYKKIEKYFFHLSGLLRKININLCEKMTSFACPIDLTTDDDYVTVSSPKNNNKRSIDEVEVVEVVDLTLNEEEEEEEEDDVYDDEDQNYCDLCEEQVDNLNVDGICSRCEAKCDKKKRQKRRYERAFAKRIGAIPDDNFEENDISSDDDDDNCSEI